MTKLAEIAESDGPGGSRPTVAWGSMTKRPSRMREDCQAAEKGPDARRRPMAAREAYFLYVERAAEGANAADGPFSAAWLAVNR
jgi:hypothetical protein